jgi:hypothetical protein
LPYYYVHKHLGSLHIIYIQVPETFYGYAALTDDDRQVAASQHQKKRRKKAQTGEEDHHPWRCGSRLGVKT